MIGLEYVFNRSGPMTMGASQMCMFAKSDPSLETPDLTMACSTNEYGYIRCN
jgi:choline dehydrogenase